MDIEQYDVLKADLLSIFLNLQNKVVLAPVLPFEGFHQQKVHIEALLRLDFDILRLQSISLADQNYLIYIIMNFLHSLDYFVIYWLH